MTYYSIGPGQTSTVSVGSGGGLSVSGGESSRSIIYSGGTEEVVGNGISFGDTVRSGATLFMFGYGSETGSLIGDKIDGYVQFGGTAARVSVGAGGDLYSLAGYVSNCRVGSGGLLQAFDNTTLVSSIVSSGGELYIQSKISNVSAVTTSDTILSGGVVVYYLGSNPPDITVSAGGVVEFGGTVVGSGKVSASEIVSSPSIRGGVTISSGDVLGFYQPRVSSGGLLILHSGGVASGLSVAGGTVEGPGNVVGSGVDSGGLISDVTFIEGPNAEVQFASGPNNGVTSDRKFEASGGKVIDALVTSNGYLTLDSLLGDDLRVADGGVIVASAGVILSGSVVRSGGELLVGGGPTGVDALASDTVIDPGGRMVVISGTVVSAVTVHEGGLLSGTGVHSGYLTGAISDGGAVRDLIVADGAVLAVSLHGRVHKVEAASGGEILLMSGAKGRDVVTAVGGVLSVAGTIVYSQSNSLAGQITGDGRLVQSAEGILDQAGDAASFSGRAVISGGMIELSNASDLGTADIAFEAAGGASATLEFAAASQPANGATFGETLLDFNTASDRLDLTKVAFVSGATATLAGHTLTLSDGTYVATFTLGATTASNYLVSSDGQGGTLITAGSGGALAIKAGVLAPASLAQALAGFDPSQGLLGSPPSAHALVSPEYVLASPDRSG